MFRLEDGRYIIDFNDGYPLGKTTNYVFDNGVHVIGSVEPTLKRPEITWKAGNLVEVICEWYNRGW